MDPQDGGETWCDSVYDSNNGFCTFNGLCTFIAVIVIGVISAMISCCFWGIWYWINGSYPMVMGISRFWLDSFSMIFYGPFAVICIVYLFDEWDALEYGSYEYEGYKYERKYIPVSFKEFLHYKRQYPVIFVALLDSFIIGLMWSFPFGLAVLLVGCVICVGLAIGSKIKKTSNSPL